MLKQDYFYKNVVCIVTYVQVDVVYFVLFIVVLDFDIGLIKIVKYAMRGWILTQLNLTFWPVEL